MVEIGLYIHWTQESRKVWSDVADSIPKSDVFGIVNSFYINTTANGSFDFSSILRDRISLLFLKRELSEIYASWVST